MKASENRSVWRLGVTLAWRATTGGEGALGSVAAALAAVGPRLVLLCKHQKVRNDTGPAARTIQNLYLQTPPSPCSQGTAKQTRGKTNTPLRDYQAVCRRKESAVVVKPFPAGFTQIRDSRIAGAFSVTTNGRQNRTRASLELWPFW